MRAFPCHLSKGPQAFLKNTFELFPDGCATNPNQNEETLLPATRTKPLPINPNAERSLGNLRGKVFIASVNV